MSLTSILTKQITWSRVTFGPGARTRGILAHIKKEIEEVEASPTDMEEWIDMAVLAFDGAWRCGNHSAAEVAEAYMKKMEENYSRKWPDWRDKSEDEPIEHDRSV